MCECDCTTKWEYLVIEHKDMPTLRNFEDFLNDLGNASWCQSGGATNCIIMRRPKRNPLFFMPYPLSKFEKKQAKKARMARVTGKGKR